MSKLKIAITGARKVAEMAGGILGRKAKYHALRGVVKTANQGIKTANYAADRVANMVRQASSVERTVSGEIGRNVRNASSAALNKMRPMRTKKGLTELERKQRAYQASRESRTIYPKTQVDQHVKDRPSYMTNAKRIDLTKGPRRDRMGNNIKFRDESVRPRRDRMTSSRPVRRTPSVSEVMPKSAKEFGADVRSISDDYKSGQMFRKIDRGYTDKQVRAGRRTIAAAAGGYAASQYFKDKRSSR